MKILLTGHRGFIGSHLLHALKDNGHSVSTFEWGEILPSVIKNDWVIHVGAISSTTETDVEKVMEQNVDFTIRLYDTCKNHNIKFQFASSASVYGLGTDFKETSQVDPRTPYAWSKYLCERYILKNPSKTTTQMFRYFNVYGPKGESHKGSQASPYYQFSKQACDNGIIKVFENSQNYHRDFISVETVVNYHLKFLQCPLSGVFNIGTGTTKSFLNVAAIYKVPIITIPMPDNLKTSYQKYTCADMTNTHKALSNLE